MGLARASTNDEINRRDNDTGGELYSSDGPTHISKLYLPKSEVVREEITDDYQWQTKIRFCSHPAGGI